MIWMDAFEPFWTSIERVGLQKCNRGTDRIGLHGGWVCLSPNGTKGRDLFMSQGLLEFWYLNLQLENITTLYFAESDPYWLCWVLLWHLSWRFSTRKASPVRRRSQHAVWLLRWMARLDLAVKTFYRSDRHGVHMGHCSSLSLVSVYHATHIYFIIWGFPKMGVPPNHPFIDEIFRYKSSCLFIYVYIIT